MPTIAYYVDIGPEWEKAQYPPSPQPISTMPLKPTVGCRRIRILVDLPIIETEFSATVLADTSPTNE